MKNIVSKNTLRNSLAVLLFLIRTSPVFAQSFLINGHIAGIGKTPILFMYSVDGRSVTDTVIAANDHFQYSPARSDNGQYLIRTNAPRFASVWYEPGVVTLTGSATKSHRLIAKGGKENDTQTRFGQSIGWVFEDKLANAGDADRPAIREDLRKKTMQFASENLAAKVSAKLVTNLTFSYEDNLTEYESLYDRFSPEVKQSEYGKSLAERIKTIKNQPKVGKPAPDFTLADTSGTSVSLAYYRGKYVLLDFWGHWCAPCIRAMPALKALQTDYAEKLVIIGIGAEYEDDKDIWRKTISKHQADWVQLSEFKAGEGTVNTAYNIVQFPTYYVLDKDGVVIGKANHIDQLKTLLATLK